MRFFGLAIVTPLLVISSAHARCLKRETRGAKRIIVQMFEWTWDSIAAECTAFLGPQGYGYVQVSPPQETIQGSQWWTSYQPVSYQLNSKRGSRSQFSSMITTCNQAGVGVIVDTIWNHMAGIDGGTGIDGSSFTHYNYPGIYTSNDFHHNCGEADGNIDNYTNRTEVQNCNLVNLADLATETEHVRNTLAAYATDLISLGAVGLRLDASKHMNSGDIAGILSLMPKNVYVTQEVIWGSGEPIQPSEYISAGEVQEFRYTSQLQSAFSTDNLAGLAYISTNPTNWGWVPSDSANVFVANHDTERNGASINYKWANNAYTLANVFMLSYPYGTPTVLSGYSFDDTDAGGPNGGAGTCSGQGGTNGWLCQHRWAAMAGMTGFANQVFGKDLNHWVSPAASQIAFGRGASGFVAINYSTSSWSTSFSTGLPDGTYCDVVHGAIVSGVCNSSKITVSGGNFVVTITSRDAVAIHIGAVLSG